VYGTYSCADNLTKAFGEQLVLDHVDIAIETGSVFALLGPNGAGKTTTVRILATLMRPDEGRRVSTYSGGMRRRLDLAISTIERPRLLFLDEPTTGLDPRSRESLWASVRGLVNEDVTVLLTTQYLEEADQLADTIAVLRRGRIVAQGTADELKSGVGAEVVRLQFADIDTLQRARNQFPAAATTNERLRTLDLTTDGTPHTMLEVLAALEAADVSATKVSTYRPSLDDVFMTLTSDEAIPSNQLEVAP
jgi:ABC-2 type transport system ATP-binding protein